MKHRLKTLLKLTACTTIAMYVVNKFIESTATVRHFLTMHCGNYFSWRYGKIFYKKIGSGSPVLLIHDLHPASSSQEWEEVIDSLSKQHTVYAIDLLGCGRSDKPNITYSNFLYVQLISDFAREIIKDKAIVISTGKSDSFVITTANMYPELFDDLYLVNPEGFGKASVCPDKRSKAMKAILCCPILGTFVYYLLTSRSQMEYDFAEKYFYNPFHLPSKTIHMYYESAHLSSGRGRFLCGSLAGNFVNLDIRYALSKLNHPVHLIFGDKMDHADKIAACYQKINPMVTYSFIEKTKMLPQLEAPKQFCNLILDKS